MPRKAVRSPEGQLAKRLDFLFRTVTDPATAQQYQHRDVADAINQAAGHALISHTYIWQLRTGQRDNPTRQHIAALAAFFQVSPLYFFGDQDSKADDEATVAWRDEAVRDTALRAAGLSAQSLAAVQQMIDNLRQIEGLPAPDGTDGPGSAAAG
jgi:transcriptional regulator with XRE-family HTH domain